MGSEKVEVSGSQVGNISLFTEQLDNSVKRFEKEGEGSDISNNNYYQYQQDQDYQPEYPKTNSGSSNMGLFGFGISLAKPTVSKPNRRKISKLLTDIKTATDTQTKDFKTFVVRSSSQMSNFVRSVGQSPTKIPSISEIRSAFSAAASSSSKFESESSYSLISNNCEYDDIVYPTTHVEDSHDESFGSTQFVQHLEKIPTVEELINNKN